MKKSNTAQRLNEVMAERNLKQVDVLRLTVPYCNRYNIKMNKSDLSQYCSGKVEPNQDKLFVLSAALNVNEAWLMGFDVPKERGVVTTSSALSIKANEIGRSRFIQMVESVGYTINKLPSGSYEVLNEQYQWSVSVSNKEMTDLEDKIMDYVFYSAEKLFEAKHNAEVRKKRELLYKQRANSIEANAAHDRTDRKVTEADIKHDEDIMNDDNF